MAHDASVPQWSLSDRLRKIRRDRHLTQEQIAHTLGVNPPTWSAWESGRTRPHDVVELASAIERAYGVPAAWVLGVLGDVPAQRNYGRRATDHARPTPEVWQRMAVNMLGGQVLARTSR